MVSSVRERERETAVKPQGGGIHTVPTACAVLCVEAPFLTPFVLPRSICAQHVIQRSCTVVVIV